MQPVLTLMTDFGQADGYVAAMKGVLLSSCPGARIIDASHDIPPGDIEAGAWVLREYARFYPEDTIHVCVVDPGVGSPREALLLELDGQVFIGPDNGLFSWVIFEASERRMRIIDRPFARTDSPSTTFHGRDIFAWAAGAQARGTVVPGRETSDAYMLKGLQPSGSGMHIQGRIVHIDRFGNCITNLPCGMLGRFAEGSWKLSCGRLRFTHHNRTYSDVASGEALLLTGSHQMLELAINGSPAALTYGIKRNDVVVLEQMEVDRERF